MLEHYLALHMPLSPKITANSLHPHSNWPPIWQRWISHKKWEKEGGRGRMAWCFWTYLTAENLAGLSLNINKAHMALLFCRRSLMEGSSSSSSKTSRAWSRHAAGGLHFNAFVGFPKYASISFWTSSHQVLKERWRISFWAAAVMLDCYSSTVCHLYSSPVKPLKCYWFPSFRSG